MYSYEPWSRERVALLDRPMRILDQVILTPHGMYRPYRPYSATLATWSGVVLNAVSAITYNGRIDDVLINKAEVGLKSVKSAPATVKADGQTFEVWVKYTNLSSQSIVTGVEVRVTKPDNSVVAPAIDWTGQAPGELLTKAYNIAAVNLTGNWTAVITYYAK